MTENYREPDADEQEGTLTRLADTLGYDGTVVPMFCPDCDHPPSYHHSVRGCTMPLNENGSPVGRWPDKTVRDCYCGESPGHRRERLRTAMYRAKTAYKAAEKAYTDELHAQRVALEDRIERGRD